MTRDWPFAEVAVPLPVDLGRPRPAALGAARPDAFTYAIPGELAGAVHIGSGVRVPFGRQRLIGVVVGLAARTDLSRVRDIEVVVDDTPWLSAESVALARWIAGHYRAPLFSCLQPFLPPGTDTAAPRRFRRTDAPVAAFDADPDVLALVGAFGRQRSRTEAALRKAVGPRKFAAALAAALAGGLVEPLDDAGTAPRARTTAWARRLVTDPAAVDAALARLRPHAAADVLAWLRRPDITLPTIAEVGAATGAAGPAARALARLAADGLVLIAGPSEGDAADAVLLTVQGARARAAEHALRRVTAHVEALEYLTAAGGAARTAEIIRQTTATATTLAGLEKAGLIAVVRTEGTSSAGAASLWSFWSFWSLEDQRDQKDVNKEAGEAAPPLTTDQASAWTVLAQMLDAGGRAEDEAPPADARVALIHGVTGSGKTELYLRAIAHVAARGQQAVLLVPEIALTPQMVDRFEARFPGRVGLWHSEMTPSERRDAWQRARSGAVTVVVGSRSAVFSPLPRLGVIIVDEEHADAYKQDRSPRYHARDVARERARLTGAAVLLGSATPAVTSYWHARRGVWTLIDLPRRVVTADPRGALAGDPATTITVPSRDPASDPASAPSRAAPTAPGHGDLPPVRIVDMRAELRGGNTSIFSRPLAAALQRTLAAGEQAILFLNRRGSATFVQCRDCGHVQVCPRCDAPLTQHVAGLDAARPGRATARLVCHACGHTEPPPMLCPACTSHRIRYVGLGTERLERETLAAFPGVRTLRWDADTTGARGAHAAHMARFSSGQADVLIGTQMITKGLDLPLVTLVGVVSADTALHFPDYRASERAFQLLAQVAGRAGRSAAGGHVIIQTYNPDHPAITFAAAHDFAGFYTREIAFRAQHGYPPWRPLWRLLWVTDARDAQAEPAAAAYAAQLRAAADRLGLPYTDVRGPAPAFFHRQRDRYRWQILLSSPDGHALLAEAPPPPGWRVDVDAVDVL